LVFLAKLTDFPYSSLPFTMNPHAFNMRPMFIPMAQNPNFAYYGPFPVAQMQYQLSQMQNFSTLPLQFNLNHPFYRNLALPKQMMLNNSPSTGRCTNENTSVCTIFDDDHEKHDILTARSIKTEEVDDDSSSVQEIKPKIEFLVDELSSYSEVGIKPKIEAKVEFKLESSDSSDLKVGRAWPIKREVSEDDDDEDDDETWDQKVSSVGNTKFGMSQEGSQKGTLKSQLKDMIDFIIEHYGRIREADLVSQKMKYVHSPVLMRVFDLLYEKYACTFKTRAEIVKYITRKAFSTIKNNSKKDSEASSKEACKVLCKRYFQVSSEEIQNTGVDIENRERFLQLLFPYQKNSKNKLQDNELISKLMSSKEFFEDYCLYVQDLDTILEADNNRKLNKFIVFIISCINKGQIDDIMKYKRVPWLKAWLDNTKIVAKELAFSIQWKGQQTSTTTGATGGPGKKTKKVKTEKQSTSQVKGKFQF